MMRFVDGLNYRKVRPKGTFEMKVLRSGVVIDEYRDNNLIVNGAFFQLARLVGNNTTGRSITKIGFGTGNAAPAVTDTELTDQYLRQVSGYSFPEELIDGGVPVVISWVLPTGEGNGMSIAEFGLFTQDETLFARKTRVEAIPKADDISLEGNWTILF
jgi:hypothetical protein